MFSMRHSRGDRVIEHHWDWNTLAAFSTAISGEAGEEGFRRFMHDGTYTFVRDHDLARSSRDAPIQAGDVVETWTGEAQVTQ